MSSIKPAGDDSANELEDLAIRIEETRELHITNELGAWQGFINIHSPQILINSYRWCPYPRLPWTEFPDQCDGVC